MAQGKGWHGDSKGHAAAAKGDNNTTNAKDASKTQGWHGDAKGHAKAAKGETKDSSTIKNKLFGNE